MATEKKLREYLKWVTASLEEKTEELREREDRDHEPIAIVGMSCRFPGGVTSPEDLWRLVAERGDGISAFPADRGWDLDGLYDEDPDTPGKTYVREGGFLYDAAEFDSGFFGIGPSEALAMDPQQRLVLEASWEAIERAGLDPAKLHGSDAGVFLGLMYHDYGSRPAVVPEESEGYLATGDAGSVASGRVAYTLGWEGPAVTVDTACSSSLVSLHLAVQSLRRGECSLALAGGVTVMASPAVFTGASRHRGLAPDGRSKAFASAADGVGFSEGVGMLLVERLSDAVRAGHRVLAVVRGTAVNQDGASNGLAAPNGPSQRRVIEAALADARLTPAQVDAVEGHGTGTRLGDPIEAQALLATYGRDRDGRDPLWLGSVKSNLGHTQAAAGVAGVIKMVLALENEVLPGTLHVDSPSDQVDWSEGAVELLAEARPWPRSGSPRRAGVSSFGVSGTNAHVVIEQAPDVAEVAGEPVAVPRVVPWVLSGKTEAALRGQARRLAAHLGARPELSPVDLGRSLVESRSAFDHRAVVLGGAEALRSFAADGTGAVNGVRERAGKTVFVFPGQGSQWVGMAQELLDSSPVFAARLAECSAALESFVDWSLTEVLGDAEALERVDVVQPALFAVMVSLAELWRSHGVEPAAVVGHSQGEIAAAVVAGALTLEDGARVVALRSQAIARTLAGRGGMVSIAEPVAAVRARLAGQSDRMSVAAVNGPSSTVVSGAPSALAQLAATCGEQGVHARMIPVDYASHSAQVEDLEAGLLADLAAVAPTAPRVPLFSTVTGDWLDGAGLDAAYWYRNLRRTVRFEEAIRALAGQGFGVFVEISAHPVLVAAVQETAETAGVDAVVVGSLRRGEGGQARFLTSVAEAYVRGVAVDWAAGFAGTGAQLVALPTYAFQRNRYWWEQPAGGHQTSTVESWRHRVEWVPLTAVPEPARPGSWLAVMPEGAGDQVLDVLRGHGADVVTLEVPSGDDRSGLAQRLRQVETAELAGVVSLLAVDRAPEPLRALPSATAATLTLVQALGDAGIDAPLWCVTRGAVSTGAADPIADPADAMIWGLGRVVALEHPGRWGGLLDLPETLGSRAADQVLAVLTGVTGEDQVAIRPAGVFARRLAHAARDTTGAPLSFPGTTLITGGTGALGGHVARRLARDGAEHLVLTSRRGSAAPGAEQLCAELTELGAEVTILACDTADRDALAAVLDQHPVNAVFHTAGTDRPAAVDTITAEDFEAVAAAKVLGAAHLDVLLGDRPLAAFVLFSSNAGVWGGADQGAYAAANAYLDALAERRRATGLPATSIAWGGWAGGGLLDEAGAARLSRLGMREMAPEAAVTALAGALELGDTTVSIADMDWARFLPVFTSVRATPFFDLLPAAKEPVRVVAVEPSSGLAGQLAATPVGRRDELLTELVRAEAAAVLGLPSAAAFPPAQSFRDSGLDSVTAVELRNRLRAATGLKLPTTLVFDHPSPVALATYLRTALLGEDTGRTAVAAPVAAPDDDPVVIVSMSCRYPGGVDSPDDLWNLVSAGGDAIGSFPTDRGWDLAGLYDPDPAKPGTTYAREGGFVHDLGEFDAGFFGISPREAVAMDPQQRLVLEAAWETVERAGIDPASLRGHRTGVFVGAGISDYLLLLLGDREQSESFLGTSTATSVVSGRVAYTLGLEGPAVTVDTACSSSLVSLHLAVQSLRRGECTMALAGGVSVMATPTPFVIFARQRGLAADGRCKAFADAADGTGWAEGVGMVLLERLSDARRNGHPVLAVVRGSAINQDGASNGLTAPHGPSQERVILDALADARLGTADVDVVEAHGTGTTLGDPIEAQALLATYGRDRAEEPLWLGSLKSNIGHSQHAAGIAGVIKTVLSLGHGLLPKTLHVDKPSGEVDWTAGAVELLTEDRAWPETGRSRRAGVSAFGMSGTNAHVIVEQAPELPAPEPAPTENAVVPWVLSGRSHAALRAQAQRLLSLVEARPELSPLDVGSSLVTSRSCFEHRATVTGETREELLAGVRALVAGTAAETAPAAAARPVFVFPGQGSQWVGMAEGLLESSSVFAARMVECGIALGSFVDWRLLDVLGDAVALERVDVVQPVLFAVMVSLAEVWRSYGVEPGAVVGHSQGEIAAAVVAGALSLEDGARVVALRSQAIAEVLAGRGGMVSVALPVAEVRGQLGDAVSIAAVNGPSSTVVSGAPDALDELLVRWESEGVRARRIPVDYASHSAQVEDLRDRILSDLAPLEPRSSSVPVFSTVTGEWLGDASMDAGYWLSNLRQTVRFEEAVRSLGEQGFKAFIECSAHPVLTVGIQETLDDAVAVGSLRRDEGSARRMLASLGEAFAGGVVVDWTAAFTGTGARRVDLPTYAFQRRRYWWEQSETPDSIGSEGNPRDAAFWRAVEGADLASLAATLELDDESLAKVLPALTSWRHRSHVGSTVDSWRYRVDWSPVADRPAAPLTGTWLAVVPAGAEQLTAPVEALSRHGAEVVVVPVEPGQDDRAEIVKLIGGALTGELAGVLSLLAHDERAHERWPTVPRGAAGTLALVQALGELEITAPLWLLTRSAVATGRADRVPSAVQAQVWGLGRVVAVEHPERWGGLIDLPEHLDERALTRFVAALAGHDAEDQLAVRASGTFARRLVRAEGGPGKTPGGWRARGTVLVTGGTGAIGGHVARWLAGRGAEHLVLVSRRGPDAPGADALRAELTELGARVTIAAVDVADRDSVAALLASVPEDCPLTAVMHTAGVGRLLSLADTTLDGYDEILRGKVEGARHLDELLADTPLDAFVLFSSIAGVWGSGDHGAYAAANAYLDTVAAQRRSRGLAGTSVAWGVWQAAAVEGAGGMSDGVDVDERRWYGLPLMDPGLAIAGLQQVLDLDETAVSVVDVDWDKFFPVFSAARARPLFREIPEAQQAVSVEEAPSDDPEQPALARQLAGADEARRQRMLLDLVRTQAAAVLQYEGADTVAPARPFRDLGFDSLTAVELRNRLNTATGLRLPTTIVFDHPTAAALAGFLRTELLGEGAADVVPSGPAGSATEDDPIAIVAMSCRLPGGIRSPEALWRLLESGGDAVGGLPTDRGWDLTGLYDPDPDRAGKSYAREGGFLDYASEFDPAFFGISPREAVAMDPQQRLMLETSWEVLERAGIEPESLRGSDTAVFFGANYPDYSVGVQQNATGSEGHLTTGTAPSIVSGRVAYTLGLEGAAVTIDTACSSSLVALHLAARALRDGECSLALAGGVAIMSTPGSLLEFSRQRGLARDGRCKAFAEGADGMSLAEGAGVLLVERLSDARRNGHPVLALVRGTATNQDGTSNGLTAPNGQAQQRVIRQALVNARLSATDIDVVEAHGTGTSLGDPIEAHALLATYGQDRPADRPLLLGSVKSNLGHTQAAAGAAGVMKMVLALQHGVVPRTLHAQHPSTRIDWSAGDIELLTQPAQWPAGDRPRRAGVSSFGISGTNAHVIIEQAPPAVETPEAAARTLSATPWPLSARSPEALRAQADQLSQHLRDNPELSLTDLGHSLAVSRATFEHRAVVVAADREEFARELAALAAGRVSAGVSQGIADTRGETVFVFPGQGSQWAGMANELMAESAVFRDWLDRCERALAPHVDWSLAEVLRGAPGAPGLAREDVIQPVLFAVMVSLAEVWKAHGVAPSAVVGHSQGEIAAACVAGALSLEDAALVAARRSKVIEECLAGQGGMASLALPLREVEDLIADWAGRLFIGAVNGVNSVAVSGERAALDELFARCAADGVRVRRIPIAYASHTDIVDAIHGRLLDVLGTITPRRSDVPFFSSVDARWADTEKLDASYWFRNLRQTVLLEDAVRGLAAAGHDTFIEVSAHPTLTAALQDTLESAGHDAAVFGTLRRNDGGVRRLFTSLAQAHAGGTTVDWAVPFHGTGSHRVDLPTYPFQRDRYWLETAPASETPADPGAGRFWAAVENQDLDALAATLAVDADDVRSSLGEALPLLSSWRRGRTAQSTVDSWRYRVAWKPLATVAPASLSGTWLLVTAGTEGDDLTDWTRKVVEAAGGQVVLVDAPTTEAAADRLALLVAERAAEAGGVSGVLSLLALDETPHPEFPAIPAGLLRTLELVQGMAIAEMTAPLWLLTHGAVAVDAGEAPPNLAQTQAWALGRVAALEHPQRWGGLVDVTGTDDPRTARGLVAALAGIGDEDQLAVRPTGTLARRLVRAPLGDTPEAQPWQPRGTVLITGGTGALGAHVARWAAGRGAEHLVLTSRRGRQAPGVAELEAELAALGSQVTVAACDVADRESLAGVLAGIPANLPLSAVVHAAGVGQYTSLADTSPQEFARIASAKVAGAAHLDELLGETPLDAFVLFSSNASVWGSGNQGAYAAANAYLEAFAAQRQRRGHTATALAWGLWGGDGMGGGEDTLEYMVAHGVRPMAPELAVAALVQAVGHNEELVAVADVDWATFVPRFAAARTRPLVGDLPEVVAALSGGNGGQPEPELAASAGLLARLAGLPAAEQESVLLDLVREQAAVTLGLAGPEGVRSKAAFRDLGFDSLTSVELRNRLGAAVGRKLPAALVFDHPTPVDLGRWLRAELAPAAGSAADALSELDRLEETLSRLDGDDAASTRVGSRLQALLWKWEETRKTGVVLATAAEDDTVADATDEELFGLLDDELGAS